MIRLVVLPSAASTLRHLPPALKQEVKRAIRAICGDPNCGESLQRELSAYRKFKVRRFRLIYSVDRGERVVTIVAVGSRATIYEDVAEQLRMQGQVPEDG